MSTHEIAEAVMALPEKERLDLARRIVASLAEDQEVAGRIAAAIPGIEDVVAGKVTGLTEDEFRSALK